MAESPAVGDIVKNITDDVKILVQGEIDMAKAELAPSAKNAGVGAGLFGAAGYFGLNALTLLYIAGALGIAALGLPIALGFVIMAVILLVIAAILALVGRAAVKKIKGLDKTVAEANASVAAVKGAVSRATAAAKAPQIEGRVVSERAALRDTFGRSNGSPR
ncbi:hypothetical protein GCM10009841_01260 [Microlunatus panaciterrae]|uniref:Membrane protein implicated in regulation of membrane protease activity n=1 Tax=Microlunatus panaciterrae TaxID=400768 RepID=A0ABS2RKG4_9ACTN|nr:phage holin family protein [Microlunatus panaciterrae]MBM7799208.1 membrane protein implicated in regulation of membrane protease activity [Microlunatus panaciterrae]